MKLIFKLLEKKGKIRPWLHRAAVAVFIYAAAKRLLGGKEDENEKRRKRHA